MGRRQRPWPPSQCPCSGRLGGFVVIIVVLAACPSLAWATQKDIYTLCHNECTSSLVTQRNNDFNIRCNDSCKVDKCQEGCDLWTEALSSNCRELCNGSHNLSEHLTDKALYCMMGCHFALNVYLKEFKDVVGIPSAPVLDADSRTNVSIGLKWEGSTNPNITYLVQWKYKALPGDWEYYEPTSPLRFTSCTVKYLHPYTQYKFRIAWIILPEHDPLMSRESVAISTLPYGAPSSAPTKISSSAIAPTRILVYWDPPFFCNGPILSYTVTLKDSSNRRNIVKEISNVNAECFYLFTNLEPDTLYTVSVVARNQNGEGPSGLDTCRTPLEGQAPKNDDNPYLILGARGDVIKQSFNFFNEPEDIYKSKSESGLIRGVSLHVPYKKAYFSDSLGLVYSISLESPLEGNKEPTPILNNSAYIRRPSLLSVDWLNDKLYLVDEKTIGRCDLNGTKYEKVIVNLPNEPTDLKVDPYNGFLFLILNTTNKGNLYKIDLKSLESEPVTLKGSQSIFQDVAMTAFAADHSSLQLLLPSQANSTVFSVSFDGLEVTDIRQNTQQPKFGDVKSFVVHNNLFYWTTGDKVIGEEHDGDTYYHNSFSVSSSRKPFVGLNVLHPNSQPYPVPLSSVNNLSAIFDTNRCKISWTVPKLLRGIGQGAWQKWHYELLITDSSNREIVSAVNISATTYMAENLQNNVIYNIKVRAYSKGGKGPWTEVYKGRTLRKGSQKGYPFMLWSSREGILKSNMLATVVEPFFDSGILQNTHIVDFSWYDDLLFLNTNTTHILVYNMSSRQPPRRLHNINSAHSLAVDWFARKLYWSNPYQQVISRSNLDGTQQEPLPIPTVARELNVDSASGFLYWTTIYSVECARLNGAERQVYYQAEFFPGKQVLGLTVDTDNHKVYWMIRSQEGSHLFQGTMAGSNRVLMKETVKEIRVLKKDIIRGPLRYYSDRLFWLHDQREALITDINGFNLATLKGPGLSNLKTLTVVDPLLHPYPKNLSKSTLNVRPHQVSSNIRVQGSWDNFTIVWQRITNVNYGTVFYEIKVDCEDVKNTMITEDNFISLAHLQPLSPYSNITIALRAFTYWSSSRRVMKVIHSPMSVPSEPLHPRIFISHEKPTLTGDQKIIIAHLRWSAPEKPNGIIKGYHVSCWTANDTPLPPNCNETLYNPQKLEHTIDGLYADSTYYFQVVAFTEVGDGTKSSIVEAKTAEESPVPRLLLTKLDAVQLADMDSREEQLVAMDTMEPVDVTYLSQDGFVFWIDRRQGLMRSNINGANKTQLLSLTSGGSSLTVDWIGRFLYWSEVDESSQISNIWKIDLNSNRDPKKIVETKGVLRTLRVNPFSSMLLWTLQDESKAGRLMSSDVDGGSMRLFFSRPPSERHRKRQVETKDHCNCTCPEEANVGKPLTIDVSNPQQQEILWVDQKTGHIWASDMTGCKCHIVVNASFINNYGLPPTSLTVDKTRVYWSNATLQSIFCVEKPSKSIQNDDENTVTSEVVNGVNIINAIGSSLQPMPDVKCLIPSQYGVPPNFRNSSPDSITIAMAPVHPPQECNEISRPSIYYKVFYRLYNDSSIDSCRNNFTLCQSLKSYDSLITIRKLLPYRHYAIQVAVGNCYSSTHPYLTPEVVFMTKIGAPSKPTKVKLRVLSPVKILVNWGPPTEMNGPNISYYLHWEKMHLASGHQRQGEQMVHPNRLHHGNRYDAVLENLLPAHTYYVSVRAYSSNMSFYSESEKSSITTFPVPGNLSAKEVTSSSLVLKWRLNDENMLLDHTLNCTEEYSNKESSPSQQVAYNSSLYFYTLSTLLPKKKYLCRFLLKYCSDRDDCNFTWPKEKPFSFETLGDRPGEPGIPFVTFLKKDTFQVTWDPSLDNGGKILYYILQAQSYSGDLVDDPEWKTVYNGSQSKWLVAELDLNFEYYFRVMAFNEYGASNYSHVSTPFNFSDTGMNEEETSIILAVSISVITVLILITFCVLYRVRKQREKDKLLMLQDARIPGSPEVELATLQDLPHGGNFRHQTNILYSIGNNFMYEELAVLPHISRDQIILTKFLGSGAFGEVFEGFARDLHEGLDGDMKVAIKTLRKGATDQEKAEFLKEAQLMSNFKHEHILSLLGVCLDNDPNFIILELMEGGDLLSYLRNNRPIAFESSPLTVPDLISICVDVAKGCKYLEEMHFVHRDLAARNCLVSSRNPALRIVKIGDFGLARDIYKNDYYRKEGEGLLPVRWMSPESLMDGVFTTQSDAWAFGVLLWEVMTLGQQPYPARNNLEVLHYVRAGGRLDKPDNCPDDLHQLMLLCWSYNPDHRPTFSYCLDQLQELKRKSADLPNCIHNNHYVGRTLTGISQPHSLVKERGAVTSSNDLINNDSLQRQRTNSMQDLLTKRSHPPTVDLKLANGLVPVERSITSSQDIPKYLELLCDDASFSSLTSDGYEVPIPGGSPEKKDVVAAVSGPPFHSAGSPDGSVTDVTKCRTRNGRIGVHARPCSCPSEEEVTSSSTNPFIAAPRYANFSNGEKGAGDSGSHRSSFCSSTNQSECLENHVPTVSWC